MVKNLAKSTATSIVYLAVALVMYGAMKNTRPSQNQHANAVTDVVERVVDDIFQNRIEIPSQSRDLADYLSSEVVPKTIDKMRNGKIDLTDYWIFNIGSVEDGDGNDEAVSLGIFGHVFVFDEDKIRDNIESTVKDEMREYLEEQDKEDDAASEEDEE